MSWKDKYTNVEQDVVIPQVLEDIKSISDEEWINLLSESKIIRDGAIFFNASEISYLTGNNKFKTREEVLINKLLGVKFQMTDAMKMGNELEQYIVEMAFKHSGLNKDREDEWQKQKSRVIGTVRFKGVEYPIVLNGRPDALGYFLYKKDDILYKRDYVIEVKYMSNYRVEDFDNKVPEWYVDQVMTYMIIFNADVLFFALTSNGPLSVYNFREDYIEKVKDFVSKIEKAAVDILNRDFSYSKSEGYLVRKVKSNKHTLLEEYCDFMAKNREFVEKYKKYTQMRDNYLEKIKRLYNEGEYYLEDKKIRLRMYNKPKEEYNIDAFLAENPHIRPLLEKYKTTKELKYAYIDFDVPSPSFYDEVI